MSRLLISTSPNDHCFRTHNIKTHVSETFKNTVTICYKKHDVIKTTHESYYHYYNNNTMFPYINIKCKFSRSYM